MGSCFCASKTIYQNFDCMIGMFIYVAVASAVSNFESNVPFAPFTTLRNCHEPFKYAGQRCTTFCKFTSKYLLNGSTTEFIPLITGHVFQGCLCTFGILQKYRKFNFSLIKGDLTSGNKSIKSCDC